MDAEAELAHGRNPVHGADLSWTKVSGPAGGGHHDDLVSDELTGTQADHHAFLRRSLQPLGAQQPKQRQRIWLRLGEENKNDTDITIYYTIDGSTGCGLCVYRRIPSTPGGRVTLKAVAVNGYGKASNALEILYKIETGPSAGPYSTEDTANGRWA